MLGNIKDRKCVACKHWTDPGATNIKFRPGAKLFDYDPKVRKMCRVKKVDTAAIFTCPKFESKF
jgi:hypothetical protein